MQKSKAVPLQNSFTHKVKEIVITLRGMENCKRRLVKVYYIIYIYIYTHTHMYVCMYVCMERETTVIYKVFRQKTQAPFSNHL